MLFAQVMVNAIFSPLQDGIKRLGGIVVRISARIFLFLVTDPLMSGIVLTDRPIGMQLVGFKMRSLVDELGNHGRQMSKAVTGYRCRPHRAVALNCDKHSLFSRPLTTFVNNAILITGFAANIFLVQFHYAAKRCNKLGARCHHLPDCVGQLPGAFLGNTDQFAQIHRGNALARIDNQIDC